MASERTLKWSAAASVAALMALAVCANALAPAPEPRRIVLCCLLALAPDGLLWQCLRRLGLPTPRMELPASHTIDQRDINDTILALEARLEHAPIALFRIQNASGSGETAPLNASARRL